MSRMIILSQDRKQLTNNLNIKIVESASEDGEASIVSGYSLINELKMNLGFYKEEQRAKQVLEEITERYEGCNSSCTCQGYVRNLVYKMPKD